MRSVFLPRLSDLSVFRVLTWLVCAGLVFLTIYPLGFIGYAVSGLEGSSGTVGNVLREMVSGEAMRLLGTTSGLVGTATVGALAIGAILAWLNERTDARVGWISDVMPVLPMLVPPVAGAVGWAFLGSPIAGFLNHWLDRAGSLVGYDPPAINIFSWPGLAFVYTIFLVPYAYVSLAAGFRSIEPSMEEAARVSGAGSLEIFRRVTLPSLGPSIGGAVLLLVAMGFALYSAPTIIGTIQDIDVLSVSVVQAMTLQFPADIERAVGQSLLLVLVVALAWIAQRKLSFGRGHATISGRGRATSPMKLGGLRRVAQAFMFGYVALTVVLPSIALLIVALQPFWTAQIDWGSLSLDGIRTVFSRPTLRDSMFNSVWLGVVVASILMIIAAIVSVAVLQRRSRLGSFIDGVTKVPAAVPNIIIAVAFVLAFAGSPFYWGSTFTILILAYVLVYFPHAAVNANAAFLQVGPRLREAAAVAGASQGEVFRRILLPLMVPGLSAGWAFVFVLVAGDLNVAVLLASTGTPVSGAVMLDLYTTGTYADVAALSVLSTIVTMSVVVTTLVLAKRSSTRQ